jgi:hypothetical protein
MRSKMICLFIFFIFISFSVFTADYYICLGSFQDAKSYSQYIKLLNDNGIGIVLEKVTVKGKVYTRIIYNKKFNRFDLVKMELKKMLNNPAVLKYHIKNLWIRPGSLNNPVNASNEINKINSNENARQIVQLNTNKKEEPKKTEVKQETKPVEQNPVENKQKSKYFQVTENGYGNILFSDAPVEYNKEQADQFKTSFTKPEKIFARCYVPAAFGKMDAGNLWYEIWVNDEFKEKVVFDKAPDPSWDQLQLWVSEEDFKKELDSFKSGEYKITIYVVKNSNANEQVKLAKGDFTYIVPKM